MTISANSHDAEPAVPIYRRSVQERIAERQRRFKAREWAASLDPAQHEKTPASPAATAVKQLSRAVKH
jgi:hypothetical protein